MTRPLLAEAVGTFALVFAGAGAIVVDARTHALGLTYQFVRGEPTQPVAEAA